MKWRTLALLWLCVWAGLAASLYGRFPENPFKPYEWWDVLGLMVFLCTTLLLGFAAGRESYDQD